MNGRGSGEFWHSTAAMITAVSTLLAAVIGLAAVLLGQQWFGDPKSDNWTAPAGQPPASPVRIHKDDIRYGPGEFRITELMSIELDTVPPGESGSGGDLYIWGGAEMSSVYGIYPWPGPQPPTATDCASYLHSHPRKGGEYVGFEEGARMCVRTDEGRTALVVVKSRDGAEAWLVDITVWNPRT